MNDRKMETRWTAARLRIIFIVLAVLLAALHTWADRYTMNPDGVAYLDMADAFVRHDWGKAINGLWSPLYPLMLGVAMAIFRPGPASEFPFVHYVNFAIFLVSLASFDFFLRQLLRVREAGPDTNGSERIRLSPPAMVAIGFATFIWSSLNLTSMADVAPYQTMGIFVYLAAGWLLRTRMQSGGWLSFALLGGVLGLGFLARAAMFPVALVFFALALLWAPHGASSGTPRTGLVLRVAVAIVAFTLTVGTLVFAFLETKGRIMLGDSATLNYAWHVNRLPFIHWQGGPEANGAPRHPTRMISAFPEAYEFSTPVGGTYPPWFDPAYWYEGVVPRFNAGGHLWGVVRSLRLGSPQASVHHWIPSVGILAVLVALLARRRCIRFSDLTAYSGVWVPAVVTFAMLSVIHLDSHYVPAFVVLLWLGVVSGLAFPAGPEGKAIAKRLVAVILIVHAGLVVTGTWMKLANAGKSVFVAASPSASVDWQVAEGLREMGLQPGDKVAILGRGAFAYWARLARARIVGEIPAESESDFWDADAHRRQTILRRFAAVGAKMIVLPPSESRRRHMRANVDVSVMGWRRVGQTAYYVMPLAQ